MAQGRRGGRRGAVVVVAAVVAAAGMLACTGAQAMQGQQSARGPQSQAYFVCPNGPCTDTYDAAFGPTPIDDIKLGGGYWDVTWSITPPPTSPFVLSATAAAPGQPLTGVDAANALDQFFDTIPPPVHYCCADVGEQAITAFAPGAAPGSGTPFLADVAVPTPGYGAQTEYTNVFEIGGDANGQAEYTIWTPVAPPTHVPELSGTGLGGAAAMLAFGIAFLRGRRRAVAGAALVGALCAGGAHARVLMCGSSARVRTRLTLRSARVGQASAATPIPPLLMI